MEKEKNTDLSGNRRSKSENLKRAGRLIDALMDEKLDSQLRSKMQEWFRSDVSDAEKQEAFVRYSEMIRPYEGRPDRETIRLYNELAAKLGLKPMTWQISVAKPKHRGMKIYWRVAAVLIPALILVGSVFFFTGREEAAQPDVFYVTVCPDKGESHMIELPDGSTVRLAGGSELSYAEDFTEKRSVKLEGDAYFTVEKMAGAPFSVKTRDMTVTVLGTEFMLKSAAEHDRAEVSLFSGSVEVAAQDTVVTLTPGTQLVFDHTTNRSQIQDFDISKINRGLRTLALDRVMIREAADKIGDFFGCTITVEEGVPRNIELVVPEISDTDAFTDIVFMLDRISSETQCVRTEDGAVIRMREKGRR